MSNNELLALACLETALQDTMTECLYIDVSGNKRLSLKANAEICEMLKRTIPLRDLILIAGELKSYAVKKERERYL